jgi:hypothetical protein
MLTNSFTPEMNTNPALEALTRLSSQLTATGFEKVTIQFSGQNGQSVLEEPKFFRTGLQQPVVAADLTAVFNGTTLDTSVLTDFASRALNESYPFWSDLFGAYGTVSYYPSQFGAYINIQKMAISGDERNLTRNGVENLYPKRPAVISAT